MSGFNIRGPVEAPMAYKNSTLVHNWYEDRFQEDVASISGTTNKFMSTKDRVSCQDFPAGQGDFTSTKALADQTTMTTPRATVPSKPSMYNQSNLTTRLATYAVPDKIAYTIGLNAPAETVKVAHAPSYLETTNQLFYDKAPKLATTLKPEYYQPGQTFAVTGQLKKNTWDTTRCDADALGGKGGRGEMTRRPAESGNVYGVSVFVDEYAKWGTDLAGKMTLGDTVSKKQTKYF